MPWLGLNSFLQTSALGNILCLGLNSFYTDIGPGICTGGVLKGLRCGRSPVSDRGRPRVTPSEYVLSHIHGLALVKKIGEILSSAFKAVSCPLIIVKNALYAELPEKFYSI